MSSTTETVLTPRQRLVRGLSYTAIGPVDVTRGVCGLGRDSVRAGAAGVRRRYREGQLSRQVSAAQAVLAEELAAAQEAVAGLPQALRDAGRTPRRGRRPWLIAAVVTGTAAVLAGGVAAVVVIRRSAQDEEPSPRPPSVEPQPRP